MRSGRYYSAFPRTWRTFGRNGTFGACRALGEVLFHLFAGLKVGNTLVRRVDARTGIITTYAGTGTLYCCPFSGDNGPATAARLSSPTGLAIDTAGNLFIADADNKRVRAIRSLAAVP